MDRDGGKHVNLDDDMRNDEGQGIHVSLLARMLRLSLKLNIQPSNYRRVPVALLLMHRDSL
jgi:hypothetical protein